MMRNDGGRCSKCKQPVNGGHNATTCGRLKANTSPQSLPLPTLTPSVTREQRSPASLAILETAHDKYLDLTGGTPQSGAEETSPNTHDAPQRVKPTDTPPTRSPKRASKPTNPRTSELRESAVDRLSDLYNPDPSKIVDIIRDPDCPPELLEVYESLPGLRGIVRDRACPYCGTKPGPDHESYTRCPQRTVSDRTLDNRPAEHLEMPESEQQFDRDGALAVVAEETKEDFSDYLKAEFAGSEPTPGTLLGAAAYATTPAGQETIKTLRDSGAPSLQNALDTIEQAAATDGTNELEVRLEHKRVTMEFETADDARKERQLRLDGQALESQERQTNSILRGDQERSTFNTAIVLPGSHVSDCNVERSLLQRGIFSDSSVTNSLFDVPAEIPAFYDRYDNNNRVPSRVSHSSVSSSSVSTACTISNSTVHESSLAQEVSVSESTVENSRIYRSTTISGSTVVDAKFMINGTECHNSIVRNTSIVSLPDSWRYARKVSIRKSIVTDSKLAENVRVGDSELNETTVEPHATITQSKVKESVIKSRSRVERSQIIGATIHENATITGSTIHSGAVVGQGARVNNVEIPPNILVPSQAVVWEQADVKVVRHDGQIYARFTAEGHSFWRHKYVYSTSTIDVTTGQIEQNLVSPDEEKGIQNLFK